MKLGVNKIVYQPSDLQSGKYVVARIFNPAAEIHDIEMDYRGNGLYMKDLNFLHIGPYIVHIYADGKYEGKTIFRLERSSSIIPYQDELEGI